MPIRASSAGPAKMLCVFTNSEPELIPPLLLLSLPLSKRKRNTDLLCLIRDDETYSDPPGRRRPCTQARPVCAASPPPADAANRTTDLRLFYEMRKSTMRRLHKHDYFWSIDGDANFLLLAGSVTGVPSVSELCLSNHYKGQTAKEDARCWVVEESKSNGHPLVQ